MDILFKSAIMTSQSNNLLIIKYQLQSILIEVI